MSLIVKHALGDDEWPEAYTFSIEEGVLVVFRDRQQVDGAKAYNRDVWASCEYTGEA